MSSTATDVSSSVNGALRLGAGLDAGFSYNTWPLMGGHLVPEDMWFLDPAALNFVENHAAVQFTHRWLAIVTGAVVLALWWRTVRADLSPRDEDARKQLYDQAAQLIVDDVSYLYLYNPDVVQAWAPGLSGYQIRADKAINFENVELP